MVVRGSRFGLYVKKFLRNIVCYEVECIRKFFKKGSWGWE